MLLQTDYAIIYTICISGGHTSEMGVAGGESVLIGIDGQSGEQTKGSSSGNIIQLYHIKRVLSKGHCIAKQ